jgi:hypothetical protein
MKIQLSPEQQFVTNFIQFYQDMSNHPDVVIQVLLDRLYDEACNLQSNRLGESIDRVIKMYNMKPAKKKKQKR